MRYLIAVALATLVAGCGGGGGKLAELDENPWDGIKLPTNLPYGDYLTLIPPTPQTVQATINLYWRKSIYVPWEHRGGPFYSDSYGRVYIATPYTHTWRLKIDWVGGADTEQHTEWFDRPLTTTSWALWTIRLGVDEGEEK